MASFTGVGDNVTLSMQDRGEVASVAISGTYNMTIALQREVGSPGSGAWETLQEWSTANATVAYDHVTQSRNESLRLIVLVDTSGTATATLTDSQVEEYASAALKDPGGNPLQRWEENGVRVEYGGVRHAEGGVVDVTAATLTATANLHAGRLVTLNRAAGVTVTLPAALGTGDRYKFFVGTTVTSNANVIQAASAADSFGGVVGVATDAGGVNIPTAAASDTLSMNGSTTGGVLGSWVEFIDVAAGKWMVRGGLVSTGAEATPFSAAV